MSNRLEQLGIYGNRLIWCLGGIKHGFYEDD